MTASGNIIKENSRAVQILLALIAFLINPTLGLVVALIVAVTASDDYDDNRGEIVSFLILTAAWISLINITKIITSDQFIYTRFFLKAPEVGLKGMILNAWGGSGKEPAFSFITWLLYYATGGSVRAYYFILSLAIYLFNYFAVYKFIKKLDVPKGGLICGILVLTFFTQYFVMSLHLVRQMLAGSIVIYALVFRAVEGKNNWILLILSVLTHTTAAFIALLSLVPWFYKWMSIKRIILVLCCFIPIIAFNGVIISKLGGSTGIEALDYGLQRFSATDATDDVVIPISLMLIVFVPLIVVGVKELVQIKKSLDAETDEELEDEALTDNTEENEELQTEERNPILPIIYICFLLIIFVLSFSKSPLIQYRFFYYSYSFIPLLLPLLFTKEPFSKLYWTVTSIFFVVRFFMIHNTSAWQYASLSDILSSSVYFFWVADIHLTQFL